MKFSSTLIALLFSLHASAALMPNIAGDRVETLPRGRFFLSAVQYYTEISRRFNSAGDKIKLEDNFRRGISWEQIARDDSYRTEQFGGLLQANGVSLNESAGSFDGSFKGDLRATVPIMGYGLTDRIGLFAAVPILKFRAEARVAYVASPSARSLIPRLESNEMSATAREFSEALNNGFHDQLGKAGYDFHQSTDETILGDVQLALPITLHEPSLVNNEPWRISLQPTLSLPTGRTANPRDLYGVASGSGRVTPGFKTIVHYDTLRRLSFIGSAGITYPFPTRQGKRVPLEGSDELISDYDPDVKMTGGLTYSGQLDARIQISRSWSGRVGIQHQEALATTHQGDHYPDHRYDVLDSLSHERLQTVHLAFEFFSLRAFLEQDFPIPLQALLGAAVPIGGVNSVADPMVMGQLALFF